VKKKEILIVFLPLKNYDINKFKNILLFCKKFYSDVKFISTDINLYSSYIELNKINFFKPILYSIVQNIGYKDEMCLINLQIYGDPEKTQCLSYVENQIKLVLEYIKENYYNLYIFAIDFHLIKNNIKYILLKEFFSIFYYLKINNLKYHVINSEDFLIYEGINKSSTNLLSFYFE